MSGRFGTSASVFGAGSGDVAAVLTRAYSGQLAEGRSRENVQPVKLKAPQGITHVITLTGRTVAVNLDRTIELTEKEAGPLRAAGFADV